MLSEIVYYNYSHTIYHDRVSNRDNLAHAAIPAVQQQSKRTREGILS